MRLSVLIAFATRSALAGAATLYAGSAFAQTCPSTETRFGEIMGYRSSGDVLMLAHRGYWGANNPHYKGAPENSIQSMQSADNVCMDGIELDVKTTSDNVAYLMHDYNLGRTTNYAQVVYKDRWYNPYSDGVKPLRFEDVGRRDDDHGSTVK